MARDGDSGEAGPRGAGELPSPDPVEAARRRAGDRRALGLASLVPVALAALALLDSLPALFLSVALGQAVGFALLRRQRRAWGADVAPGVVRTVPTRVGRAWFPVAWGLLLVAIFLGIAPLRLWTCVLFAFSLAAWPLARANVARVVLERRLPARTRVGSPTSIEYRLSNPTARGSSAVVVRDALGLSARPAVVEAVFDRAGARESVVAEAVVQFERRGPRRLRPARIASGFPLGLFEVALETSAPASVLVRPREGRALPALLARLQGPCPEPSAAVSTRPGTDEFVGLREFREGDDLRRIHWRTTARSGRRTFVERREEGTRRVAVVLGRAAGHGADADRAFERAVSVAATVLRAAAHQGIPARLLLGTEGERAGHRVAGRRGLETALDALARVRGDGGRKPLAALERLGPGAQTVVWVAAGEEPHDLSSAERRASVLVLRADLPSLSRYVAGLS